ncbi:intraflagellar transport protein 25 homolog [Saccostrea echinata]|uniref:intraflagellar transport protein 25 homolog n=1 Tax=Saccostrea echinata TaxID=191078 RepID=UPI002A7FBFD1|nr:intraflagellar transport protein 25 homolog [Saccostrea echinata]
MFDVALKSAGAQVVLATSSDGNHPPENIIDGDQETFWASTGLYPQEFIITFSSMMSIQRIEIACYNVRKISFQTSKETEPTNFEDLLEKELDSTDNALQQEEFPVNNKRATHLRVTIENGYDHFVSVHRLSINGNAVHG